MDGQRQGVALVLPVQHQRAQVVQQRALPGGIVAGQAPIAQSSGLAARHVVPGSPQQGDAPHRATPHGKVRGDQTAERKTRHIHWLVAPDQRVERSDQRVGQRLDAGELRQLGVVKARHVRYPEFVLRGQRLDIAQPVHPAAVAAVQQHQRCARAEAAPAQLAAAVDNVMLLRQGIDLGNG